MDLCGLQLYEPWLIPLSYPSYLSFSIILNATHFMCAMIWVCWLSLLDSSLFSYGIRVISLLKRSMHSVFSITWLWCWIVMDSFIWLLMLLYVSCDIQTSPLVVIWLPSGLMLILWSLVYICLRVNCLVAYRMRQPLKRMLWAWSTHGVHWGGERGWLDCWEWMLVVWLQSVVFACGANWPCVDVLLHSLKRRDWQ